MKSLVWTLGSHGTSQSLVSHLGLLDEATRLEKKGDILTVALILIVGRGEYHVMYLSYLN